MNGPVNIMSAKDEAAVLDREIKEATDRRNRKIDGFKERMTPEQKLAWERSQKAANLGRAFAQVSKGLRGALEGVQDMDSAADLIFTADYELERDGLPECVMVPDRDKLLSLQKRAQMFVKLVTDFLALTEEPTK